MKRIFISFFAFTLVLSLSAQEPIRVYYKGASPTISDFVNAVLSQDDIGEVMENMKSSWQLRQKGKRLPAGKKFVVDSRNGYIRYDAKFTATQRMYVEFCYWNLADGKHKLLARNSVCMDGGNPIDTEYTGIDFYLYTNATKKLTYAYNSDLGIEMDAPEDGTIVYALPRSGKDILCTVHSPKVKKQVILKWNGSKFECPPMTISGMPTTAVRKDSNSQRAVYVNLDRPASGEGEMDDVRSVWLVDESVGTAKKICTTNPMAPTQWSRMTGMNANAVEVPIDMIAAADNAKFAPGDISKIIVEGCPDARNIWTYIIDTKTNRVLQFPTTEGIVLLDWDSKEIVLASYGYDEDGRYTYNRTYSLDGKFLRMVGGKERE